MNKISFYLIEKDLQTPVDIALRLCKKLYQKHRIWLIFDEQTQADQFDLLLWQKDTLFIPHGIAQYEAPICLSLRPPAEGFDVCINLSKDVIQLSELHLNDIHVIEIVANHEQDKHHARTRFKYYREIGHAPVIHKI